MREDNGTVTICVKKDTVVEGSISLTVESQEKDPHDAQGKDYTSVSYLLPNLLLKTVLVGSL